MLRLKLVLFTQVLCHDTVNDKTCVLVDQRTCSQTFPPLIYTYTIEWTKQPIFFFIAFVHELWQCRLHKGYHVVRFMNTLTCQWCALVTLSAGFVLVDGFSEEVVADPAPVLKTKGMQDEMLKSKNGQHPGEQHLFFFIYYCTHLVYQCRVYVGHWESYSSW